MTSKLLKTGALFAPFLLLTGCVDTSYDLDNVDMTTELKITDLTIPVNIDPVTLGDFFKPNEDDDIKEIVLGGKKVYALTKTGDFNSDDIEIATVSMTSPALGYSEEFFNILPTGGLTSNKKAARLPNVDLESIAPSFGIEAMGKDIDYSADDVDKAIKAVKNAKVYEVDASGNFVKDYIEFTIDLKTENTSNFLDQILFTDLVIMCPKGLALDNGGKVLNFPVSDAVGKYNPADGKLEIKSLRLPATGGKITLRTNVLDLADCVVTKVNDDKNKFTFSSQLKVLKGGKMKLIPKMPDDLSQIPNKILVHADYDLSKHVCINSVSATIEYTLEDMNIDPVELDDLPDFLDSDETNLVLASPQIYLNLNNPVADINLQDGGKGLKPTMSIHFRPERENGVPNETYAPSEPLVLYADKGVSGPYNYVLAPQACELSVPEGYEQPKRINFDGMRYLLGVQNPVNGVAGLPKLINIDIDSPKIPTTAVENFPLGSKLNGVTGKYELLAPLALGNKSLIIYSGNNDWDNSDMDDVNIEKLAITCDAVSHLPVSANLSIKLIKKYSENADDIKYFTEADGIKIDSGVNLPSESNGSIRIGVTMSKGIKMSDIKGIEYYAKLWVDNNESPLAPDQKIVLSNVKATISGSYTTNFED